VGRYRDGKLLVQRLET